MADIGWDSLYTSDSALWNVVKANILPEGGLPRTNPSPALSGRLVANIKLA